eukprot:Rhum_TRINITY_DN8059_c0_g1::Rhum_TRINITY_DN8059_c0_g1_i1::g.26024::m.26024/K09704/K09704; uncharacterized protein
MRGLLSLGAAAALAVSCTGVTESQMKQWQTEAKAEVAAEAQTRVKQIREVQQAIGLNDSMLTLLEQTFSASFQFTAQHTFDVFPQDNSTYVTTGDIGQMWLRDSSSQLSTYLPLVKKHSTAGAPKSSLQRVFESAMTRQVSFINTDAYASAFTKNHGESGDNVGPTPNECPQSTNCEWCTCTECSPACGDYTYQRNYELDSLLNVLLLHYNYWVETGITAHVTNAAFAQALQEIVALCRTEMNHNTQSKYVFFEPIARKFKDGVGLVWSYARPSDDQAAGGYSIPDNMMLVVVFNKVHSMLTKVTNPHVTPALVASYAAMAASVEKAIEALGVTTDAAGKKIYAYEVDGYGRKSALDDANMPNLLWLPYLGYSDHLQLYNNTRAFVLSSADANYFSGSFASGLGSQHHSWGLRSHNPGPQCRGNCIWHLGLIMQGMTTPKAAEKKQLLETVLSTLAGQKLLHEGFTPDDPTEYNRDWFGWADATFSAWVLRDFITPNLPAV